MSLTAEEATRFEMPAYYTCDVEAARAVTRPSSLLHSCRAVGSKLQPLDEPVSLSGMFVKQLPQRATSETQPDTASQFICRQANCMASGHAARAGRIAWNVDPWLARNGRGLLDQVRSHGRLHTGDAAEAVRFNDQREAFYQMLDAAGQNRRESTHSICKWQSGDDSRPVGARNEGSTRRQSPRFGTRLSSAPKAGRYSFAPLFNDAEAPNWAAHCSRRHGAASRAC